MTWISPIGRLLGDQVGHEGLEIDAFFLVCVVFPRMTPLATFERGEKVDRAVPFVRLLFKTVNNLAAAGQDISARRVSNAWIVGFLVDAQDQRVFFRRVQVETDNIGGLGCKLRGRC